MLAEERRLQIVSTLNQKNPAIVQVAELSERMGVSGMTIRRDLDVLESMSIIRRVHGGAISLGVANSWVSFTERRQEHLKEKQAISMVAAQYIHNKEKIILDAGTTTQQIPRFLASHSSLTMVTHSIPVAEECARYLKDSSIILLGGELRPDELCSTGPITLQYLSQFSFDKFFLSAAGFSIQAGISDPDIRETQVKQAMMKVAHEVILIADSSKWNHTAFVRVAEMKAVDTIISDDGLPEDAIQSLKELGIEVMTPSRIGLEFPVV
jgi:DeoR family fructose operon transcriptional repressor